MSATSIHVAAAGLPILSRSSSKRRVPGLSQGQSSGLRLPADRLALKSAFYNAASSLAGPETDCSSPPRITMRVASKDTYICRDCGYIYSDRKPFDKLPEDFFCPVCGAPKRRFKPYAVPVSKNANDTSVRKARKADLKRDETLGSALPVGIAVGVLALVGTFVYLNSQL